MLPGEMNLRDKSFLSPTRFSAFKRFDALEASPLPSCHAIHLCASADRWNMCPAWGFPLEVRPAFPRMYCLPCPSVKSPQTSASCSRASWRRKRRRKLEKKKTVPFINLSVLKWKLSPPLSDVNPKTEAAEDSLRVCWHPE